MKRAARKQAVWVGSGQIGNVHFVAVSLRKPKHPAFVVASLSFHSILLKDLDHLYRIARRDILCPPPARGRK